MESGEPVATARFFIIEPEGTGMRFYISKNMTFNENRILIEHFTYRSRDMFICRTVKPYGF